LAISDLRSGIGANSVLFTRHSAFGIRHFTMVLREEDVRSLLRMEELIPAIVDALRDLSSGKVEQPMRLVLPVSEHKGFFGVMPASGGALGAKLVTFYPNNKGMPTHHAMILLFRPETGEPLVTMDGRLITEMRTAAASAVATDALAREDASVLAILGSGVQARSHLEALRLVRKFREVRVWSPRNSSEFARRHGISASASAEEAVRGAAVIVVATAATTPILMGEWLSPGAHINAVGATRPNWRELDDDALRKARIYVDSREAAMKESGDIIAAGHIFAEIGEVLAGSKSGRESDEEITLFKSVGVAVEDIVAADLVYRKAGMTRLRQGYGMASE
jgi:ornithine cyclodeaminase/alanine dehydrogenase-like protein (mu-crystallin family)